MTGAAMWEFAMLSGSIAGGLDGQSARSSCSRTTASDLAYYVADDRRRARRDHSLTSSVWIYPGPAVHR
jgi:hypothetical protein